MRKKWLKRLWGSVLCAVLFVSEVGVSSWAVEEDNKETEVVEEEAGAGRMSTGAATTENVEQESSDTEEEQSDTREEETQEMPTKSEQKEEEPPSLIIEKVGDPKQTEKESEEESEDEETDAPMMMMAANVDSAAAFVNTFSDISDGAEIEIELQSNITITSSIAINAKDVIISISGNYTINVSPAYLFTVTGDNVKINLNGVTLNGGGIQLRRAGLTFGINGNENSVIQNTGAAIDAASVMGNTTESYLTVEGMNFKNNSGVSLSLRLVNTDNFASYTAGGGIAMWGGTLAVRNSSFTGNKVEGAGGAIYTSTVAMLAIEGCTFSNNRAINGGALTGSGVLEITGSKFENNIVTDTHHTNNFNAYGGAIMFNEGSIKIDRSEFKKNTAEKIRSSADTYGGAIRTLTASMNITNTHFVENEAQWGGGIYAYGPAVVINMENCTGTGNIVDSGEASYAAGGVAMVYNGTLNVTGGTYEGNKVTGTKGTSIGSQSAGSVFRTSTNASMNINGGIYRNNSSVVNGGAIEARGSGVTTALTITGNVLFEKNTAENWGGAIYSVGKVVIGNGNSNEITFKNNEAANGGAIYLYSSNASLTMENSVIHDNEATTGSGGAVYAAAGDASIASTKVYRNNAKLSGGGIYMGSGTLTLNTTSIYENTADGSDGINGGGGVYVATGRVTLDKSTNAIYSNTTAGSGGGIAAYSGSIEMNGGSVHSNTANGNGGGGIAVYSGAFRMTDGTIGEKEKPNKAKASDDMMGSGGGVFIIYGAMETTGGMISYNEANNGGGIYFNGQINNSKAGFDLEEIVVSDNIATENGGGIYANIRNTEDKITGINVKNNKSSIHGGGIYLHGDGINTTSVWSDNKISGNTSARGAGVSIHGTGSLVMQQGEISGNEAEIAGGGVYSYLKLTLKDVKIFTNKVEKTHGGGIVINGMTAEVKIEGGEISGNNAAQHGGGIYIFEKGTVTITKGAIIGGGPNSSNGNTAGASGGGIYLSTGSLEIDGDAQLVQINHNTAGVSGGGVYVRNGTLEMSYAQIENNNAEVDGGGVYLLLADADTSAASVFTGAGGLLQKVLEPVGLADNITRSNVIQAINYNNICGNHAKGNGGGFYIHIKEGATSESIIGNIIDNNSAGGDGGGAYVNYNGTGKTILNNEFTNNTASGNGGGLYITGSGAETETTNRMSLTNDKVTGNSATNGGGIYLDNSALVLLNAYDKYEDNSYPKVGATISNNKAGNGGGIYIAGESELEIWSNTTISKNKADSATGYGGGIYVYNQSNLIFKEPQSAALKESIGEGELDYYTRIIANTASNGAGIYGIGSGKTTIINALITQNTATVDGGGIWVMRERLKDLFLTNVIFVNGVEQNYAGYYQQEPALSDINIHSDNVKMAYDYAGISKPDTNISGNENKQTSKYVYNNYDVRYHAGAFDVIFNANSGLIGFDLTDTYSDNYTSSYLEEAGNQLQPLKSEDKKINAKKNNASFLNWFSKAIPNSIEENLADYKVDLVDLEEEKVNKTTEYYAGWLYAPTIDDIYESNIHEADSNMLTGKANPGAEVVVLIDEEEYHAVNNDGQWELDISNIIVTVESEIEVFQYYEEYKDKDGISITSPFAEGNILEGYEIFYDPGYGTEESKQHKVGNNGKFKDSYRCDIYPANTFKREGYELIGWSLGEESSSAAYGFDYEIVISNMLENEAVIDNTITFYAVWKMQSYTLTYEPGETEPGKVADIMVPMDTTSYSVGGRAGILDLNEAPEGYYFAGWKLDDNNGTVLQPGSQYTFSGERARSITLTALWEPAADIHITKKTSDHTVDVGGYVYYEITVTNSGKGSWEGILTDELPAELGIYESDNDLSITLNGEIKSVADYGFLYSYYESGNAYAVVGDTNPVVLASEDEMVLKFKAYVRSNAQNGAAFKNYVIAEGEDAGGNLIEAEAKSEETTVVYKDSAIVVEKIVDPTGRVEVGDTLTYTISIVNSGGYWSGRVTDTLPEGIVFSSDQINIAASAGVGYSVNYVTAENILEVLITELGENQRVMIRFETIVQVEAAGKTVENLVVAKGEDRNGNNNDAEDSVINTVKGFAVTYHKGIDEVSGEVPTDEHVYSYKEKVIVEDKNNLEYEGYYFAGWSTNPDYSSENLTGEFYRPGKTFNITGNTDLYAVFYKNPIVDIELEKKEYGTDNLLNNAEFELKRLVDGSDADETNWIWEEAGRYVSGKSGKEGYVKFAGLEEGVYRGYETAPPDGYQYPVGNSNYITVQVEAQTDKNTGIKTLNVLYPTLKVVDGVEQTEGWVESVSAEGNKLTAYNMLETRPYTAIALYKVDEGGGAVDGAQFTLYKLDIDEHTGEQGWQMVGGSHESHDEEGMQVFSWNTLTEGRYEMRESKMPVPFMMVSDFSDSFQFDVVTSGDSVTIKPADELPANVEPVPVSSFAGTETKAYRFQVVNVHEVVLEKIASTTKAYVGDEFSYDIVLTNYSESLEWSGAFTDVLPEGLAYVSHEIIDEDDVDDDITVSVENGTIDIQFAPLNCGETAIVRITVRALKAGTYVNAVDGHITSEMGHETDLGAEADQVVVDERPVLTKKLTDKNLVENGVIVGDVFSYTISITNPSKTIWTGTLIDNLPDGMEYISHTVKSGDVSVAADSSDISIYIEELDADETVEVEITVLALKSGIYKNHVKAILKDLDDYPYIEEAGAEEIVIDNIPSITKKVDKTEVTVGDSLTYTIEVVNDGIKTWDLVLTDELEAGLIYQCYEIVSGDHVKVTEQDGIITITIDQMIPDTSAEIKLHVQTEKAGYYTNVITGTKTDENGDIFDLDDAESEETHVKDPEKSTPPPIDIIYEGDREVSGTGEPGSEIVVTFPNGSREETIVDDEGRWTVSVPDDVDLKVDDEVTAIQTEPDKLPSEETVEPVKPLPGEDIHMTKSVDQTEVMVGDELAYTVRVENNGHETWNLILTDAIEKGLLYQGYEILSGDNAVVTERNGSIAIRIEKMGSDTFVEIAIYVKTEKAGYYTNVITGIKIDENGAISDLDVAKSEQTLVKDPEKSIAPPIDDIYEGDRKVSGDGVPGSEIVVTFPDGSQKETIVDEDGRWTVQVPDGVELKEGDIVTAIQTEPDKLPSEETKEPVKPLPAEPQKPEKSKPPIFDDIYEGDTVVKGDGIPGSTVIITFPDGTQIDARVDENGRWSVEVPKGIYLKTGEVLYGIQIEPGKLASDKEEEPVKPLKKEDGKKDSGRKKDSSSTKKSTKKSIKTGDDAPVVVFLGTALLAAAIWLLLNTYRKRQK